MPSKPPLGALERGPEASLERTGYGRQPYTRWPSTPGGRHSRWGLPRSLEVHVENEHPLVQTLARKEWTLEDIVNPKTGLRARR